MTRSAPLTAYQQRDLDMRADAITAETRRDDWQIRVWGAGIAALIIGGILTWLRVRAQKEAASAPHNDEMFRTFLERFADRSQDKSIRIASCIGLQHMSTVRSHLSATWRIWRREQPFRTPVIHLLVESLYTEEDLDVLSTIRDQLIEIGGAALQTLVNRHRERYPTRAESSVASRRAIVGVVRRAVPGDLHWQGWRRSPVSTPQLRNWSTWVESWRMLRQGKLFRLRRRWLDPRGLNMLWLAGSNLERAMLFGANLLQADLGEANLRWADLEHAMASEVNLARANLAGALLDRAFLAEAKLSGANLSGASMRGATLSGADLSRANVHHAYLSGAYLHGGQVQIVHVSGPRNLGETEWHACNWWDASDMYDVDRKWFEVHYPREENEPEFLNHWKRSDWGYTRRDDT